MNRKAQAVKVIISLIIGLLIIWILSSYLGNSGKVYQNTVNPIEAQTLDRACKLQGDQANAMGKAFSDYDDDGYPDSCDLCVDVDNSKDKDGDFMADGCEPETRDDGGKINCVWKEAKGNRCASEKIDIIPNLVGGSNS